MSKAAELAKMGEVLTNSADWWAKEYCYQWCNASGTESNSSVLE